MAQGFLDANLANACECPYTPVLNPKNKVIFVEGVNTGIGFAQNSPEIRVQRALGFPGQTDQAHATKIRVNADQF